MTHGHPSTAREERLTMVCYARPAAWLAAVVAVAWLVFAGPVSHFLGTAALALAVTAATAGATVAAALVFAALIPARRRRAADGGCVSCRFRCQHAMTERTSRLWLVTTADRRPPQAGQPGHPRRPGGIPTRSVPAFLPMPTASSAGTAPRWPYRPARHGPSG
jgi:hypothetical protein